MKKGRKVPETVGSKKGYFTVYFGREVSLIFTVNCQCVWTFSVVACWYRNTTEKTMSA
jgi:predicted nucleic acid-binding Zn finger protein